jgi:hypothetical protein
MFTETGEAQVTPDVMAAILRTPMMLGVRSSQIREQVAAAIERGAALALVRRLRLDVLLAPLRMALLVLLAMPQPRYGGRALFDWDTSPPLPRAIDPIASLTSAPHGPTAAAVGAAA